VNDQHEVTYQRLSKPIKISKKKPLIDLDKAVETIPP